MASSRSCIKCLKSTCEKFFTVSCGQNLATWSSFPEVLYKRGALKNFSKFADKHKKQSSRGVLSKDVLKNFAKFTEKHPCQSLFCNKVTGWKPETVRSSHKRCFVKKGVFKNFSNFTGKNLCWSLFLVKVKVQDFRFLNGTMHHIVVNGAV